jgi:hypothetical protein
LRVSLSRAHSLEASSFHLVFGNLVELLLQLLVEDLAREVSGSWPWEMVDDAGIAVGRAGAGVGTRTGTRNAAYFQRTQIDGVRQAYVEAESKL